MALAGVATGSLPNFPTVDIVGSQHIASVLDSVRSISLKPTITEIVSRQVLDTIGTRAENVIAELGSRLVQEAVASFSQSQRLALASIEQMSALGDVAIPILGRLGQANIGLSNMIGDLGAIYARSLTNEARVSGLAVLMPNVAQVARTYNGYLADVVSGLGNRFSDQRMGLEITVPTGTTSAYVGALRKAVDEDVNVGDARFPIPFDDRRQDRGPWLDDIFRDLGPNYSAMWQGSWVVLNSDSPDRIRQAAHSGRELLMQILAELAPDSAFDAKEIELHGREGKVTRKMRVQKILVGCSASTVSWVDAMAKALEEMYSRLAAISHDRNVPSTDEQQIAGLLHALGGLLAFIEGFRRSH